MYSVRSHGTCHVRPWTLIQTRIYPRFGRRPVLIVSSLLFILSALGMAASPNYDLLLVRGG